MQRPTIVGMLDTHISICVLHVGFVVSSCLLFDVSPRFSTFACKLDQFSKVWVLPSPCIVKEVKTLKIL